MLLRSSQLPEITDLLERVLRLAESVDRALLEAQRAMLGPMDAQVLYCPASVRQLDSLREAIEQRAHRLLAQQPRLLGSQLRTASVALTVAAELARIGEYAHGIAALAARGRPDVPGEPPAPLRQMAYTAREMLQQAVRAIVVQDSTAAHRLRETAALVDMLHDQIQGGLAPGSDVKIFYTMWMADNLERIVAGSVTIAEQATFIVTGLLPSRPERADGGTMRVPRMDLEVSAV